MNSPTPFFCSHAGPQKSVPADGDFAAGVLETMRAQGGIIPLLPGHMARLTRSAHLDETTLERIEATASAIAKRTEAWPNGARVRLRYGVLGGARVWDFSAVPLEARSPWDSGVALALCDTRVTAEAGLSPFSADIEEEAVKTRQELAHSSPLGCKLLQRETYSLAERELSGYSSRLLPELFHEGLLLDHCGRAIEGLRSNLLVWRDGHWSTPSLRHCGVRGVMLNWLAARIEISEDELQVSDIEQAEEVAVCNAVRGVVPVLQLALGLPVKRPPDNTPEAAKLHGSAVRTLASGPATRALRAMIKDNLW